MKSLVNFENMMLLSAFNNLISIARSNVEFDDTLIRLSDTVSRVTTVEQRQALADFSSVMEIYDAYSDENLENIAQLMLELANDIESLNE